MTSLKVHNNVITLRQWLIKNGYDPAQAGLVVKLGVMEFDVQFFDSVSVDSLSILKVINH